MEVKKDQIFSGIFYIFIGLILCLGIFLRTKLYLSASPYSADEAMFVIGAFKRTWFDFWNTNCFGSQAPPLFLGLTSMMAKLFGPSEYGLRFIPYISSILSLFLFYFFSRKIFNDKLPVLVSLFIFAIHGQIIFFSSYLRPYSIEVLFTIAAFYAALFVDFKKFDYIKLTILAVICALAYFTLFSSIIVIMSLIAARFIYGFLKEDKEILIRSGIFGLINIGILCIYYFVSLHNLNSSKGYEFVFFPKTFVDYNGLISVFSNAMGHDAYISHICLIIAVSLMILIGLFITFKKNLLWGLSILTLLISASLIGCLDIYPLTRRMAMYLTPVIILTFCMPLDFSYFKNKYFNVVICILFLCYFATFEMFKNVTMITKASSNNVKLSFDLPKMGYYYQYMVDKLNKNEILFVDFDASHEFRMYNDDQIKYRPLKYKGVIPKEQLIIAKSVYKSQKDLDNLLPNKQTFYMFGSLNYEENPIQEQYMKEKCNCTLEETPDGEDFKLYKCRKK